MSLYRYAAECGGIASEIQQVLTGDEYEEAFDVIGQYSIAEWYAWRRDHHSDVDRLASATPAQRAKLLARVHGKERITLVFAACQYCLEAAEILDAIDQNCTLGISYRTMISAAHTVKTAAEDRERSFWPWGGWPGYRDFPPPERDAAEEDEG